jgi:putative ABC transport system ATP-binding protein
MEEPVKVTAVDLERQRRPVLSPDTVVLRAEGVTKYYQTRCVLNGVGFGLRAGERVSLVGPSGCGKTTLLNCLGGIDRPDRGTISLGDLFLEKLTSDELAKVRREQIGTVFQFFHLLPTLTAFENIELPLQLLKVPAEERRQRVAALLARVNLAQRAHALPGQLSGGEMQRVAIARALASRPRLILADEPTGNLDSVNGEIILDLLAELCGEHQTALLMVTHSADAARICHRILQMRDGVIIRESTGGGGTIA